jgi:hypothetical protein
MRRRKILTITQQQIYPFIFSMFCSVCRGKFTKHNFLHHKIITGAFFILVATYLLKYCIEYYENRSQCNYQGNLAAVLP